MLSTQTLKSLLVYGLLLSVCLPGSFAQSGFVNPTVPPQQQFPAAGTSSFTNSHAFPINSGGGFSQTKSFSSGPIMPAGQTFFDNAVYYPPPPMEHHAAKGFYPMTPMGGYSSYPFDGQYWTGQPGYHYYDQYQMGYPYHGQHWGDQYMQPYGYSQFGYSHPHMGYNNYFGQYPHFDASYWTGHMYHPQPPVYMHPMPMHYKHPMHYPMQYPGHPFGHQQMYGHYPALPYYPKPRGFLGGTGGNLAKGVLGAVLVGLVAGKVARGK